eukprot:jgi/Ulvmu1/5053/UM021_0070.1
MTTLPSNHEDIASTSGSAKQCWRYLRAAEQIEHSHNPQHETPRRQVCFVSSRARVPAAGCLGVHHTFEVLFMDTWRDMRYQNGSPNVSSANAESDRLIR